MEYIIGAVVLLAAGLLVCLFYILRLKKFQGPSRDLISGDLIKAQQENSFLKNDISLKESALESAKNALAQEQSNNLSLEKRLSAFEEKTNLLEKNLVEKESSLTNTNNRLNEAQSTIISLEKQLSSFKEKVALLEKNLVEKESALIETNEAHKKSIEKLEEKYNQSNEKMLNSIKEEYQTNLKTLESKLKEHCVSTNKAILDQNKLMLNEDSKKILDEIFEPIKKSVDEYSKKLTKNEIEIQTNIKNMFEYTQKIEQNANQFAKILKGDKKIRGDFGELQLKTVLESSGLIEGEQYSLQEDFTHNDDNLTRAKHYRPDAVVRLDKNRSIVIDAKFSLPNIDFSQLGDSEMNEIGKMELAKNLKSRIDELAKKPYSTQDGNTYDYVLLFIPYQNILDLVLSVDNGIYKYAEHKKIYLATPHTLFMALKTISITWRHIQSDQNIKTAFEEISKAYDKFAGVLEDFKRIKNNIGTLQNSVASMDNKLVSGTGNMANRFEKLKELGLKTNKSIEAKQLE